MATQLERAQRLIRENFLQANVLDGTADQAPALAELKEIRDAAQNPGPQNDGSLDEETWTALMEAIRGIRDVASSFRRTEACFAKILAAGPSATYQEPSTPKVVVRKTRIKIPTRKV